MERIQLPRVIHEFWENGRVFAWLLSYVMCWNRSVNDDKWDTNENIPG